MSAFDQVLYLWLNLSPHAPAWAFDLARGATQHLMHWLLAAALTVALTGHSAMRAQAWRALASIALASLGAHLLKGQFDLARPGTLALCAPKEQP